MTGEKIGIELRGVYDGVAIWKHPDGTLENRFAQYLTDAPGAHWCRIAKAVQEYIDKQEGGSDA